MYYVLSFHVDLEAEAAVLCFALFLWYFPEIILIGKNVLISLLFYGCNFFSGKSNSVTGIAKAINAHFRKYPLAVVNVKGRANGTSIQEVVSKLEVHMLKNSFPFSHLFLVEFLFHVLG